ncbi:MAG: hypothetical protein JW699_04420 [Chitinispirillaceae bacterium]|nr:hypothetical protein [Chitinispirillaceae bacterium]
MLKPGSEGKFPFAAALNISGFLGFFFFILFYIDPPVIYSNNGFDLYGWVQSVHMQDQSKGSAGYPETGTYNLELTRLFFREAFSRPGCFTYLTVCAILAVCHIPLLGTAALLLVALLIFWAFPRYILNTGGPVLLINRWVPFLRCNHGARNSAVPRSSCETGKYIPSLRVLGIPPGIRAAGS